MGIPAPDMRTPWYWLPITGLWRITSRIAERLGIVRSLLIGLGLMLLGAVFCLSFVGVVIGIPAFVAGAFLVTRALY